LQLVVGCAAYAQGIITTIAGAGWSFRGDGGRAADAQLATVEGMALDSAGNLYAADSENHVVVRITPGRSLVVIAGNGIRGFSGDGGAATSASLRYPSAVAVDSSGNVYIADTGNHRVRKVTGGIISTVAGMGDTDFSGDGGPAVLATLREPRGVAVDATGNLYIADYGNSRIRKVTAGGIISSIAGTGNFDFSGDGGPAVSAALAGPVGLAIDAAGGLYIADSANDRIRKITNGVITSVAGGGGSFAEGIPASSARLGSPLSVGLDGAGNFYIVSRYIYLVRRVTSSGTITSVAGNGQRGFSGDGGPALAAPLNLPLSLAADGSGVYIADTGNHRIRKVTGSTISTWAGNGLGRFLGDGADAAGSALNRPQSIEADSQGNLFIADVYNNRIRKIFANGNISTVAGNGLFGFSGDGGAAANASLALAENITGDSTNLIHSMAADSAGNLYFPDPANNRIRKVSPVGIITTVAGSGDCCFSGDGPAIANSLYGPSGVAVGPSGDLYISDTYNNRIRKITASNGMMTTIAGTDDQGFSGDGGQGTLAKLYSPLGIAVDPGGNVFFSDSGNRRIRKITPGGFISTIAGDGEYGSSGDLGPATAARFTSLHGITIDTSGNIYVVDGGRIRKVSPAGIISTVAGPGVPENLGDGGPATTASLNEPHDVAVDSAGNVYIADTLNNRIRKVLAQPPIFVAAPLELGFTAPAGSGPTASQPITLSGSVAGLFWQLSARTLNGGEWLTATPSDGLLPQQVSVSANPRLLTPGTYRGKIEFNAPAAPSLLVSADVTFTVTQSIASALAVEPNQFTFEAIIGSSAPAAQTLRVRNSGGGTLNWSASSTTISGGSWLSLSANSGTASSVSPGLLDVRVNPAGMPAGVYSGAVTITSPETNQTLAAAVTLLISQPQQIMLLSQRGLLFVAVEGGGAPPPQAFGVLNTGQGAMSWQATATTLSGSNWLGISTTAGTSIGASLQPPLIDVSVNATGMSAGFYSGQIQISSSGANNSPQFVTVALNVLPRDSNPGVVVRPTGLIFVRPAGSSSPASQTVRLATAAGGNVAAGATPATLQGGPWLEATPRNLTFTSADPRSVTVQPTLGPLAPGEYFGAVTLLFNDNTSQTVNVLFVVTPAGSTQVTQNSLTGLSEGSNPAAVGCTPQRLYIVAQSLGSNFNLPVGYPSSFQAEVKDDCDNSVPDAVVVATFDSNDAPVLLSHVGGGHYQGSGQQSRTGPVRVTLRANRTGLAQAQVLLNGQVSGSLGVTPLLNSGGIVNAASSAAGEPLAPGSIISVYGSSLADTVSGIGASQTPLPTILGNATLNVGGQEVPLFYSRTDQLNAQLPFNLHPNSRPAAFVKLQTANGTQLFSVPENITIAPARPAIFTINQQGTGQGAILNQDFSANSPSHPETRGRVIQIFATGLGTTNPVVAPGQAAPSSPPAITTEVVEAHIGGQSAQVQFSGLAPNFVGLYQVNVVIPTEVSTGDSVQLVITQAGVPSNTVSLAIR
jgi:trimeric autotransporter adhesin